MSGLVWSWALGGLVMVATKALVQTAPRLDRTVHTFLKGVKQKNTRFSILFANH
jgi:hypothetical protein